MNGKEKVYVARNVFVEDGTDRIGFLEIAGKIADTIKKKVDKKELPKPDFPEETLDESIERRR